MFFDPDGDKQLSEKAYSFIAGLLCHARGMTAVTNPLVNSYKRLVPGYEAPCYLAWSAFQPQRAHPYPRRPRPEHPRRASQPQTRPATPIWPWRCA